MSTPLLSWSMSSTSLASSSASTTSQSPALGSGGGGGVGGGVISLNASRLRKIPQHGKQSSFAVPPPSLNDNAGAAASNNSNDENKTTTKKKKSNSRPNPFESEELLRMYLHLHFPHRLDPQRFSEGGPSLLKRGGGGGLHRNHKMIPHAHAPLHALGFPQRVGQLLTSLVIVETAATVVETTPPRTLRRRGGHDDVATIATGTTADCTEEEEDSFSVAPQQQQRQRQQEKTPRSKGPPLRALDIGCGVGGTAFELSKEFDKVVAFDKSESFIDAAQTMQSQGQVKYRLCMEGQIMQSVVASLPNDKIRPDRIDFFVGDAGKLLEYSQCGIPLHGDWKKPLGTFHGIVMSNLLCHVVDPIKCLESLAILLQPGGVVLIVSPYLWNAQSTPTVSWLGGFYHEDENNNNDNDDDRSDAVSSDAWSCCASPGLSHHPVYSSERLRDVMEGLLGFTLIHQEEMPLLQRHDERKYEYIVCEATAWRRPWNDNDNDDGQDEGVEHEV